MNIELPHEQGAKKLLDIGKEFHYFRPQADVRALPWSFVIFPAASHAGRDVRGADPDPDIEGAAASRRSAGADFWQDLIDWIARRLAARPDLPSDMDLFTVCDEDDEIISSAIHGLPNLPYGLA